MSGADTGPIAVVREYYRTLLDDREGTIARLVSPDVTVHVPGSLPWGGDHHGHDGFRAQAEAYFGAWSAIQARDVTFACDGDRVFVRDRVSVTATRSGRRFGMRMVEVFLVEESRIVEITPFYFDTAALLGLLA